MIRALAGSRMLRLFSSAVIDQAMLSATNFIVGLLLIRNASDQDYGHYVLAFSTLLLVTSFQGSLIGGPLAVLAPKRDAEAKRVMVASLHRRLRQFSNRLTPVVLALLAVATVAVPLNWEYALLGAAFVITTHTAIEREYLRSSLMLYSRPQAVLAVDAVYSAVLLVGAFAAVLLVKPAAPATIGAIALASVAGSWAARRSFGRSPGWASEDAPTALKEILVLGYWAAVGSVIYWICNYGYNYVTAMKLDVATVAAIAATRLLLMPVNLLTAGVKSLLMPTAATWYNELGMRELVRRMLFFTFGLLVLMGLYDGLLWVLRDWVIDVVLKKNIADRDALIGLWILVFFIAVVRDQLQTVLLIRERFKSLAWVAAGSAVFSLSFSWWAMDHYGMVGAVMGLVAGELLNLIGTAVLTVRQVRADLAAERA
ncbi:MAG: hypothetical protein Q7J29_08175 [Stagnimonas sp.]|nr:hypothetical protein [Stagnimonas sp.]